MAEFQDTTEVVKEARSERMEQRTKPTVKRLIETAAALVGADTSDFVTSAAYRAAMATIEEFRTIQLSAAETKRFLAALENPPASTEALKRLMAEYEEGVENPIR
jgi:uncharacterized protein (DUF1778 family)